MADTPLAELAMHLLAAIAGALLLWGLASLLAQLDSPASPLATIEQGFVAMGREDARQAWECGHAAATVSQRGGLAPPPYAGCR